MTEQTEHDDPPMSLVAHLTELRDRLLRAVAAKWSRLRAALRSTPSLRSSPATPLPVLSSPVRMHVRAGFRGQGAGFRVKAWG